jgi:hypothetical protein
MPAPIRPPNPWVDVPLDWEQGDPLPPGAQPLDAANLGSDRDALMTYAEALVTDAISNAQADVMTLSRPGTALVGAGHARFYLPYNFTITSVRAQLGSPSNGAPLVADLNYNGTSIMGGSKPTVADGANLGPAVVPATVALAAGGYMSVDIDSAGSDAADFVLSILGSWTA